jgi:hypothetical protein
MRSKVTPGRRRVWLMGVVVAVVAVSAGFTSSVQAESKPLRSGSLLGDGFATLGATPLQCDEMAPDCWSWRYSGCSASSPFVGRDPGWMTSIVDVSNLAGKPDIRSIRMTSSWFSVGGGVEFWTASCREVPVELRGRGRGDCPGCYANVIDETPAVFRIPANVKWMTVVVKWTIPTGWELR